MIYGIDYLAGAKYPDVILKEHPEGWAAGFFAVTFGNALPTVEKLLATGRCPHVRIQLLWSDAHSFGDSDIPQIRKLSRAYQELKKRFPHVVVEISPFCEHNLNNPDKYLDIVKAEAPDCIPVNVPWRGAFSRKYKNEIHGNHSKPVGAYNYSFDGTNAVDSDVEAFKRQHNGSQVFFFWHPRLNLKWSMKDTTPRPARKAKPSSELIDSLIYLHTAKGTTSVPKRWLVKSHAEKHGEGDLKGDKLLIISPIRARAIELKTRNGQTVDTLRYYGTFEGGGFRYYSAQWGYQVAHKARRIQGDPLCEIWINGKRVGGTNPGFRDPTFR